MKPSDSWNDGGDALGILDEWCVSDCAAIVPQSGILGDGGKEKRPSLAKTAVNTTNLEKTNAQYLPEAGKEPDSYKFALISIASRRTEASVSINSLIFL